MPATADHRAGKSPHGNVRPRRACSTSVVAWALTLGGCVTEFPQAAPCAVDTDCVGNERCVPQADGGRRCFPRTPLRAGDAFTLPHALPGSQGDGGRIGRGPRDAAADDPLPDAAPMIADAGTDGSAADGGDPKPFDASAPAPDAAPPEEPSSPGGCPTRISGARVPGFRDGRLCLDVDYCVYDFATDPPLASCDDLCADFGLQCVAAFYTAGTACDPFWPLDCAVPALQDLMCACGHP